MTIQLFANNAKTTLASGISSAATSLTVASGTGARFPTPVAGVSAFKVTLVSVATPTNIEICLCTARSGDTLTITRAQEGTTARAFVLGDTVANFDTADVMGALIQSEQLQANTYKFASAGGTPDVITATVPSRLTALTDGMTFIIKASGANTGPTTLNITLGSTATGAIGIRKSSNVPLTANDIPWAGYPICVIYNAALAKYILLNPNGPAMTGSPSAPTASTSDNSTLLATTAFVQNNLALYAPLASPGLTGTPTAPTAASGTSNYQLATTQFVNPAWATGSDGYVKFPSGIILQWQNVLCASSPSNTTFSFPIAFPNSHFNSQCTYYDNIGDITTPPQYTKISASQANIYNGSGLDNNVTVWSVGY